MIDLPTDPTLDEIRAALAPLVASNAAFDGWCAQAVTFAASHAGVDEHIARLAFDGGPVAMIDAWFTYIDERMTAALPTATLEPMKIRERITALVAKRLDFLAPDREALRRALSLLSMPQNLARAAKMGWRAADIMWNAAGDTSTDYNHYTKRSLLAAIYTATLLVFVNDESEGYADTRAFLARRIDGITKFEKAKARLTTKNDQRISLARFIGRLRYPAI
ncbi:MAG: COQ9 family protein [Sphingobium sp.]